MDGHDRGTHVIARGFRDAGFEALGAHDMLVSKVIDGLKEYGAFENTLILVGGIIREELYELGVAEIFGPGVSMEDVSMEDIIEFVRENVPER